MKFPKLIPNKPRSVSALLLVLVVGGVVVTALLDNQRIDIAAVLLFIGIVIAFQLTGRQNTQKLLQRDLAIYRTALDSKDEISVLSQSIAELTSLVAKAQVALDSAGVREERLSEKVSSINTSILSIDAGGESLKTESASIEQSNQVLRDSIQLTLREQQDRLESVLRHTERRAIGNMESIRMALSDSSGSLERRTESLQEAVAQQRIESAEHMVGVGKQYKTVHYAVADLKRTIESGMFQTDHHAPLVETVLIDPHRFTTESASGQHQSGPEFEELSELIARNGRAQTEKIVMRLTAAARDETRQVEALFQLFGKVRPRAPLPPSGRWAMDARALLHLSKIVEDVKPQSILELGGGTSTIWLGYLCESLETKISSVDHDFGFMNLTHEMVERHELGESVDVNYAPLEEQLVDGRSYEWYSAAAFEGIDEVDLLVVDGPPKTTGDHARYPALPLLISRLAPTCTVVLDDSERQDELDAVEWWLDAYPDFEVVERGISRLAVLKRTKL